MEPGESQSSQDSVAFPALLSLLILKPGAGPAQLTRGSISPSYVYALNPFGDRTWPGKMKTCQKTTKGTNMSLGLAFAGASRLASHGCEKDHGRSDDNVCSFWKSKMLPSIDLTYCYAHKTKFTTLDGGRPQVQKTNKNAYAT